MSSLRSYSETIKLPDFAERLRYLSTRGKIGDETFGAERYLNQTFYTSPEWKRTRREVIIRDDGCDLACKDLVIPGPIYVHHINPITIKMVEQRDPALFDLENLICCSWGTHTAIHYGDVESLLAPPVERKPNDTIPWRQ